MEDRTGQSVRSAPERESRVDGVRPQADSLLLDRAFGQKDITVLRHEVTSRLSPLRLSADRRHGYILAVNEVITNVVLHAGGQGRLVLQIDERSVWCVVTDSGPGIPGSYLDDIPPPEAFEVGGRGLWLAHQLCDEVTTATGPIGTSIGLRIEMDGTPDS